MTTTPFTFSKGHYYIEIIAPDKKTAEAKWKELIQRNYFPTDGIYYTETDSVRAPEREPNSRN